MKADPEAPAVALPGAGEAAARGGALRSAGFALSAGLSLVTVPLMVRHLGVAGFGRWVSVIVLVNVVGLAAELGLNALALREYPLREAGDRRRLLGAIFGLRVALVAAGVVLALAFAALADWPTTMVDGVLIASVAVFIAAWQDTQAVRLSGELRFAAVTAMEVARALATAVAVVALVVADAGLEPFFAIYIAGTLAAVLIGARALRASGRVAPRMHRGEWRAIWADAALYALATAVYVVYFRVVMLIASIATGAVEAGYFATGFRVTEFAVAVPGVLAATVLPLLSHAAQNDRARLERGAGDVLRLGLVAGVVAALALALGAPAIMDVLGGDKADAAVPVLRIQAIAVATTFFAFGTGATLLSLRRHRALLVVNVLALVTAAALAAVLADAHGAKGAAWATVAGEGVLVLGQTVALARSIRIGGVIPAAAAVAFAVGCAVGAFVLLPIPNVPATLIACAIYAAIVTASGQLPPQIRALLRRS